MEVTMTDLRRRPRRILAALERNEKVTILYRGRKKGVIHPVGKRPAAPVPLSQHPACGMWKDRADLADVAAAVRRMRRGRFDAL